MELIYTGKFRRDYRQINSKELLKVLNEKFKQLKKAQSPANVPHFKKLRRYDRIYRLEIQLSKIKFIGLCVQLEAIKFTSKA